MICIYRCAFLCVLIIFCCPFESKAQLKLYENFESGEFPPSGWTVVNTAGDDGEWKLNNRNTYLGNGCAVSNFSIYSSKNYLISKRLTPASGDSLIFYFKQTFWNNYNDTFNVLLSNTDSLIQSMGTVLRIFNENINYPNYLEYGRYSISLNAFAGQTVWIAFQHKNKNGDNIRLDDISVGTPGQVEVSVVNNIFPIGKFGSCSNEFLIPSASIRNNSSENITTNFNVTYKITGPVIFTSTKPIIINGGELKVVNFDTADISVPGIYNVKIYSSLPNDPNKNNDTIYSYFEIVQADYGGGIFYNGGYYFSNSTECAANAQSKPQFSWKDTINSVNLILNKQRNSSIPFTGNTNDGYFSVGNIMPTGYSFRYYGQNFDSVFISTNGIIGFKKNDALLSSDPTKINSLFFVQLPAICAFWADMDFGSTLSPNNRLSYKVAGKYLVITYDKAHLRSGEATEYLSFQISLELVNSPAANSRFILQYQKESTGQNFLENYSDNTLRPHFVGFKNTAGNFYLKYRFKDSTGLIDHGTLFNSSVAAEFGASQLNLNNKSSDLNLTAKFEGFTPRRDTVTIQIRDTYYPYKILESKKIYMNSNGTLTGKFSIPAENYQYYIALKHRNSLETWSKANGEFFTGFNLNYNFSTSASNAYGSNMRFVNGSYYIYSGDINEDGLIDLSDYSKVSNDAENFLTGYNISDINGDGLVDLADILFTDNNAFNFIKHNTPLVIDQNLIPGSTNSGK